MEAKMVANQNLTGYPSIDKPWLKYYSEEAINAPLPEYTIYEYLWENNKDHLNDVALIFYNKEITYRELFKNIDTVAGSFAALGVRENDVVTILMLNQPEAVYCLYALSKIGATANFINVLSPTTVIENYIAESCSSIVVTLDMFAEKVPITGIDKIIAVSMFQSLSIAKRGIYQVKVRPKLRPEVLTWSNFVQMSDAASEVSFSQAHHAVIGHTGGTTGTPKGFVVNDAAINGVVQEYKYNLRYQRGHRYLNLIPPFVMYGICTNLHMPLSLGMTTILIPRAESSKVPNWFTKYKPNHVSSVPALWSPILSCKKYNKENMSYLITAGAGSDGMTSELETNLNTFFSAHKSSAKLLNGYGMSEVCATACTCQYEHIKPSSVGIPLSHNIISAFDTETQEEKAYGEIGELCISTPYMMIKYLNNPDETAHLIRIHSDGRKWVHTGDIGYVDADGYVFIKGRMKRIFKVRDNGISVRVFPDHIEETVTALDGVVDCCAVPQNDPIAQNRVVLFVEAKIGIDQKKLAAEITETCQDKLPKQYVPQQIEYIDKLPLTSAGKVDFRALEKEAEALKRI